VSVGENLQSSCLSASDKEFLQELYKCHYRELADYASVLLCQPHSEDVVQNTFLIAALKIAHLKASENPVGWLYLTLKNLVRNDLRERKAVVRITEKILSAETAKLRESEALDEQTLLLWSCREALSDRDWSLLYHYYCLGYTCRELADTLHIEEGACRMRILRARRALAQRLGTSPAEN